MKTKLSESMLTKLASQGLEPLEPNDPDNICGSRFPVREKDGSGNTIGYRIARLSKGGGKKGGLSVRVGKTLYKAVPLHLYKDNVLDVVHIIHNHLVKHKQLVASHLFGDSFVVCSVSPKNDVRYYKASVSLTDKRVYVDASSVYDNRGHALAVVHRQCGTVKTRDLSSLSSRPVGLYSC